MKKTILALALCISLNTWAQEHFSGISTSNRVGILNGSINPAEFSNLSKNFNVSLSGFSFNVANDKISFKDLNSDVDIENILFNGNSTVNARIDASFTGPSFAMKWRKWGFALVSKANMKFDIVDLNPALANALINNIYNSNLLTSPQNQKINGISYGEIGLYAARTFLETEKHKFSGGATLKLLFPGTYSNFGISNLNASLIQETNGDISIATSGPATINFAYSSNLTDSFVDIQNYSTNFFGKLNGFAGDIGFTYQYSKCTECKDDKHNLKVGMSIRNIGSMTFKNDTKNSTTYTLDTSSLLDGKYDLSSLNGINSIEDIKNKLYADGLLSNEVAESNIKVKLPTSFTTSVDVKILPKLYVTGFLQQKLNKDNENDQISIPNIISIIPRVNLGFFEAYIPVSNNEISGTNVGFGLRLGGFYIGTGSMVSALINDTKQADFYTGFSFKF